VDECKPLPVISFQQVMTGTGHAADPLTASRSPPAAAAAERLILVHFSAQPEPFLTQNTPYTHPNTPSTPPNHPLKNPYMHPLSHRKRLR
jgi:hypothetical protein